MFQAVPGHPYVSYRTYNDGYGQFWIECKCSRCPGSLWRKNCLRPDLWQDRVFRYAAIHGHGLRPRAAR